MGKKAIREKNTSRLHFLFKVPLPSKYIVKGILDGQIGRKNNRAKFIVVLFSLLTATHAPTTHNVSFDKIINLALQGGIIMIHSKYFFASHWFVVTKTWNDLKPPTTTYNHLKKFNNQLQPSTTTSKKSTTTRKQSKTI